MIEYVEIRDKTTREIIDLIDSAKSIIWHPTYYGVGDFEIYVQADEKHIELLQEGNWVTRPDKTDIGLIEKVGLSYSVDEGTMIVASGSFAKSILSRRHIYRLSNHKNYSTTLSGRVENAVRVVVQNNAINCSFDTRRNISFLELGANAGTTETIIDDTGAAATKQASFENLLEYTDEVLQEYKLGSKVIFNDDTKKLQYVVYKGTDRSADNTGGNEPIIFSQEYDNVTDSEYSFDNSPDKTAALIGGEGEGLDRFYSLVAGTKTGINRKEMFVDASSVNRKYKPDDSEEEKTYTVAQYTKILNALGKQELAGAKAEQKYDANINVNGGIWRLNEHYFLGDIVTFQDNKLNKFANVRITEITEVQDENGYSITPVFDFEEGDVEIMVALTTENNSVLMTQSGAVLQPETAALMTTTVSSNSSTEISGVKISELPQSTDVYAGCCIPIVTNGETKKLLFSTLENKIEEDLDIEAITNARIDEICI